MINGAVPKFSNDIQDADAWKALFSAFLESRIDVSKANLQVATDSTQITFTLSSVEALAALKDIFKSAQQTRDSLQYALQEVDSALAGKLVTSEFFDDSEMRAHQAITGLFDKALLDEVGIREEQLLDPKNDHSQQRVFRLPIPNRAGFDLIWQGKAVMLKAALLTAKKEMLLSAFKEGRPFTTNDDVTSSDFTLEPALEKIVAIEQLPDGSKCLAIRYGEYLKLLYPHAPNLDNQMVDGKGLTVSLNRNELIDYLRYTFQEGFMLAKRQPVLLPAEMPIEKVGSVYTLVLDCSGSMQSVFESYKNNVKSLCGDLIKICAPGDIIRIVNFSDGINDDKEWVINPGDNATAFKIAAHIEFLYSGGSTRLYGTVYDTLTSLQQKHPEREHCLIVFTDGDNTISRGATEEMLVAKIQELTSVSTKRPPRIFTMGLGSDYKEEVVKRWSVGSGVSHIHLNSMQDFDAIYKQGAKLSRPRLLKHIVQDLFHEVVSVFNDSITLVDTPLQEGVPFQVSEKTYAFQTNKPIPTADLVEVAVVGRPSFTPGYGASIASSSTETEVELAQRAVAALTLSTRPQ